MKIGVLCLQGSFAEHLAVVKSLGQNPVEVRTKSDFDGLTHLIIPGGESTVMRKLAHTFDLWQCLQNPSLKIMGTCAGAILQADLGLGAQVVRNAYGAQSASCIVALQSVHYDNLRGCFIRAPRFQGVSPEAEIVATRDGEPVAISHGRHFALTFHPEVNGETRLHQRFLGA